ncbi:flavin monoamine oxidase family protein [Kineosporia babensis]|uniref:FAD-dependent oxidoreductase n=1 Tax=Kineosporia babensis TaxID=499548 RepID=A0A9X1NL03_9ACTN|nr:NAD(P)/FAD-dependent oxidoreductase [Kineosporia babensis]MCD5315081.1 FAD-dependent oxidoreductase [Kineosporia babensis]
MSAPPLPTAFAVSRWGEDPWSRGSWSLIGRHGSAADRIQLGTPVGTRLRIAGEATHPTRSGMTHGAYEQGIEAAAWAAEFGHRRVAVLGAGMAGLGAARELAHRGLDTQVWEARDRVGGRTAGIDLDGFTFDLGANWLQQYDQNVLARLAELLQLTTTATDFTSPLVLGAADHTSGLDQALRDRLATAAEGSSVADVLTEWTANPHPWTPAAIRRFIDAEITMDAGVPLEWLSARHGFEAGVGEGDQWISGSYRLLVDHLAQGLDIRLEHPVHTIRVSTDGVTLTGEAGEFSADAVIVTAPVAVLAADVIEFSPPLPAEHRVALGHLGMGRVEKVILRFAERSWPQSPSGYYRLHGPDEGSVSEWLDATSADGKPTLVGLFAGPWLERIWAGPDAEVAAAASQIFHAAGLYTRPSWQM